QLVEIKDTDAGDVTACKYAGDWRDRITLPASFVEPGDFCYNNTCASNACEGVVCPANNTCYGGECVPDCSRCDLPNICASNACVPDLCNDGDFQCPVGYECRDGICDPECTTHADCPSTQHC